jgi:predicted TIM-barrel fold metal-dependent hydrolase
MTSVAIVDSDGHVWEDPVGLSRHMPAAYTQGGVLPLDRLFPPIDHFHFHPGKAPEGAFAQVGLEGWQAFMQDTGIEAAVLYPSLGLAYGRIPYGDWAVAVTRAYNNWLHETYLTRSPRFQGMGMVPLQEPSAAADELAYVVEELGMPGAVLPSVGLKDHLGSPDYWPFFETADRLGCCLAIHGGNHSGLGFDSMNVFAAAHSLGHPLGLMINFAGIIFNGVFDRFPNIRLAFLEGGVAWLLTALERFDRSYATQTPYNLRGDLLKLGENDTIAAYIRRLIKSGRLFLGCEGGEPDLAYLCQSVGSEAFLYSSDFPHEVNSQICREELGEILESPELSDEQKAAILHGNAQRFYGRAPVVSASA